MKNSIRSFSSPRTGFTLVELLVVIAIIAILAAAVVAGASGAINAAKRVKASNAATQIQTAIINYYTEYGVYPVPAGTTGDVYYNDSDEADQGPLMVALCGNINASVGTQQTSGTTVTNTRQIAFMTPKKSDVDTNGILINPFFTSNTATVSNDPYFYIAMDADYSGILGDSGTATGKMPDFSGGTWKTGSTVTYLQNGITQGVAVWADCDSSSLPPKENASTHPNFWVHTY